MKRSLQGGRVAEGSGVSVLRGLARWGLVVAACAALLACGGGGGSSPAPSEALVRSSGEVGPAGGTLGAQGLELEIPAGALAEPTTVSVLSFAPEVGELARFRFAPAGLAFLKPATVRVPVGSLPPGARLYWQVGGDTVLLPATREGNTLVASIGVLGFTASGGVLEAARGVVARRAVALESAQDAAPADSGDLVVQLANCQRDVAALKTRLRNAAQVNNLPLAQAIFNELGALQVDCSDVASQQLEVDACVGLSAAVAQASATRASTFDDVSARSASLMGAMANVQKTGGTCPGNAVAQADALIPTVFNQFLDTLRAGIRDGSLFEDAGPRDFGALFQYEAGCQLLALDSVCDRFSTQIYPDLLDAMRRASFDECRQTNGTLVMSQFHAMGARFGNDAKFYDHGRFSLADVRRDISYCTNPRVELRVFDDALDIPAEIVERRQDLQLAPALDDYRPLTITQVPRDGSLNINGVFRGQRCASGESLPADLVLRLSTIELARRSLNNGSYDFSAQPLDLVISQIFAQTGLNDDIDGFRLSFHLEGGRCVLPAERGVSDELVVLDQRETLFEIEVGLPAKVPQPDRFKGSFQASEETFGPETATPSRTQNQRSSFTMAGQFEEGNTYFQNKLTGLTVVADAEYRYWERVGFSGPDCSYIRTYESVLTISGTHSVNMDQVSVSGGLVVLRDEKAWTFSDMILGMRLPAQGTVKIRYENIRGSGCAGLNLNPSDEPVPPFTPVSVRLNLFNSTGTLSRIQGAITGDGQGSQQIAVNGAGNRVLSDGSYRRTSVSMQLADR
ncbi:MAG: hypothetical protein ACK4NM_09880 [Hydrogenophaga sp.]